MMAAGLAELLVCQHEYDLIKQSICYVPLYNWNCRRQYGRKLLEQVGSVACLLELLDDSRNNVIVDAADIVLPMRDGFRRGGRGVIVGSSP